MPNPIVSSRVIRLRRALVGAALASLLLPALAAAQGAPPPPPPWNPSGGKPDATDPNLWHNPKDGPSDYVWNPKICRWVYKNNGNDQVGTHKAGDLAGQGAPVGVPPGSGKLTGPLGGTAKDGSGNTYTWDEDKNGPGGTPMPGKGWVDDKTSKPLCTPPAPAAAVAPGPKPGPGGGGATVPPDIAPEHTSLPPPSTGAGSALAYGGFAYNDWHFDVGVGSTFLLPSVKDTWQGTGTGGIATSSFGGTQFMPTITAEAWHPLTNTGLQGGFSGNLMSPTGGTTWRDASTPLFSGMMSYQQNFAGSFYGNIGVPITAGFQYLSGVPHTPDAFTSPFVFVGGGFAVDNIKASAIFPVAGDSFSVTHTAVTPAFELGVKWPLAPSWVSEFHTPVNLEVVVQDWLPFDVRMPGGNAVSFGNFHSGNSLAITANVTIPFGGPPPATEGIRWYLDGPAPPPPPSLPPPLPLLPPPPPPPPAPAQLHVPPIAGATGVEPAPRVHLASLAPVAALSTSSPAPAAGAVERFTIRFDDRRAALTWPSIRTLDEAVAAARAGRRVEIAVAGCGEGADFSNGSACARRAMSLGQLVAERGVRDPATVLAAELQ